MAGVRENAGLRGQAVQDDRTALFRRVSDLMKDAVTVEQPWREDLGRRRRAANDCFRRLLFDFRAIAHFYPQQFEITEQSYGLSSHRSLTLKWKATDPERRLQIVLDTERGEITAAWAVSPEQIVTWYRLDPLVENLTDALLVALADQRTWQAGEAPDLPGELSYVDPLTLNAAASAGRRPRPQGSRGR
jgi:hypothetical protein